MCLFFPPPKKRRYPSSALEDPRPRKKRVTYQQLPARAATSAHVRYEPLRGHGVKRDPPTAATADGTLRGHGAKRAPREMRKQSSELKVHFAMPVEIPQSRPAQHVHARQRKPAVRAPSDHRRKDRDARYEAARQYRSSLTAAQENAVHTAQDTGYDYRVPASYYLELFAVREATNHALQATVGEPPGMRQREQRHLRRQPAYNTLRYNV